MRFKQFYLEEAHSYSCAMLNLSPSLAKKIESFAKANIKNEDLFTEEGDGGWPEKTHVTVKYGITEEAPDGVESLIGGFGTVNFKLKDVTKFEAKEYDVLKIDVESPKLREMNKIISDNMETVDTFPKYHPHVTLAYVKKGKGDHLINNSKFNGVVDMVEKVYFTNKHDEEYYIKL